MGWLRLPRLWSEARWIASGGIFNWKPDGTLEDSRQASLNDEFIGGSGMKGGIDGCFWSIQS